MLVNIICTKIIKLLLKTQKEIIDFIRGEFNVYQYVTNKIKYLFPSPCIA